MTVDVGDSVIFNCSFTGSPGAPSWNINGLIFDLSRIPGSYSLTNGFSLMVNQVALEMNNTFYQCIIGDFESSIGYLFVNPISINKVITSTFAANQRTAPYNIISHLLFYKGKKLSLIIYFVQMYQSCFIHYNKL